tara:strand:+ start:401 stop:1012 length:612 start_codon:yes stop_codon:yes gene_type:complete
MKIAIIGSGIEAFCCGHRLLDLDPDLDLHVFDEKAESGMFGEEPGLFEKWPLMPGPWVGEMYSQTPTQQFSAVRYSWLVKSISISLARRGTTLHLKSKVNNIENNNVEFSGAGVLGNGKIGFNKVIDFRKGKTGIKWQGGILNNAIEVEICGTRPDNTIEVWWQGEDIEANFIQRMEWHGINPTKALSERVFLGIETAELSII